MGKALLAGIVAATLLMPATASALENEDLLSLVAMPLAVAAVSEIADVPTSDLIDLVTLMNAAAVTPPQFVEVVRYVPVALSAGETQPDFVEFVRLRSDEGVRGTALVTSIAEQLRVYGMPEVDLAVTRPRTIDVDATFVPSLVRKRMAAARAHPHGGAPGQLKKEAGVKTGAEIVHRERSRNDDRGNGGKRMAARDADRGNGRGNGKGKG
jgi:hypothetical protein